MWNYSFVFTRFFRKLRLDKTNIYDSDLLDNVKRTDFYENKNKGSFCAYIAYNENVAHNIYAGCDALLVPSRFEPCGLTQLISMRYGAVPIVRETGGLKDTVQPYNVFENTGNGFTFDRYESGLLYDAINRAKTLYFENRKSWDDMVIRDMNKDVSWEKSAKQYKDMYVGLTPRY